MIPRFPWAANARLYTLIGTLVLAGAMAAGGVAFQRARDAEHRERAAALRSFLLTPVRIGEREYRFDGEVDARPSLGEIRASRLARYALAARIDPIFGLSGVDTVRLRAAVGALSSSIERLAASAEVPPERRWLAGTVQPIAFLALLPELEERRRSLIASPSPEAARRYQAWLEKVAAESVRSVIELKSAIRAASALQDMNLGTGPPFTRYLPQQLSDTWRMFRAASAVQVSAAAVGRREIIFLRTATTEERFTAGLDDLLSVFRAQEQRARERGRCLLFIGACVPVAVGDLPAVLESPRLAVERDVERTLAAYWERRGVSLGRRTLWVATGCFGSRAVHPFSPLRLDADAVGQLFPGWGGPSDGEVFEPNLLDRLYFVDVERLPPVARSAYQSLGGRLAWQSATNFYTCPDAGYLGRLSAYTRLLDDLQARPLFAGAGGGAVPWLGDLAAAEQALVGSPEVDEADILAFTDSVAAVLRRPGEAALARAVGADTALRAGDLVRQAREQSAGLDGLINAGVVQNHTLAERWLEPAFPISPLLVAISRSAPAIHFLTFNRSFVPAAPVFAAGAVAPERSPFIELPAAGRDVVVTELVDVMERTMVFSRGNAQAR